MLERKMDSGPHVAGKRHALDREFVCVFCLWAEHTHKFRERTSEVRVISMLTPA